MQILQKGRCVIKVVAFTNLESCTPCKILHPVLIELENDGVDIEYKHLTLGDVQAFKDAGVKSTPTLVLENDGTEVDRIVGVRTKQEIIDQFGL